MNVRLVVVVERVVDDVALDERHEELIGRLEAVRGRVQLHALVPLLEHGVELLQRHGLVLAIVAERVGHLPDQLVHLGLGGDRLLRLAAAAAVVVLGVEHEALVVALEDHVVRVAVAEHDVRARVELGADELVQAAVAEDLEVERALAHLFVHAEYGAELHALLAARQYESTQVGHHLVLEREQAPHSYSVRLVALAADGGCRRLLRRQRRRDQHDRVLVGAGHTRLDHEQMLERVEELACRPEAVRLVAEHDAVARHVQLLEASAVQCQMTGERRRRRRRRRRGLNCKLLLEHAHDLILNEVRNVGAHLLLLLMLLLLLLLLVAVVRRLLLRLLLIGVALACASHLAHALLVVALAAYEARQVGGALVVLHVVDPRAAHAMLAYLERVGHVAHQLVERVVAERVEGYVVARVVAVLELELALGQAVLRAAQQRLQVDGQVALDVLELLAGLGGIHGGGRRIYLLSLSLSLSLSLNISSFRVSFSRSML